MNQEVQDCIERLKWFFPKAFVYKDEELIVEPKNNIYFFLSGIENEFDFRCKVISWLSRPAHKGLSDWWHVRIRNGMNRFLGTEFTPEEISSIYTYVGCGVNDEKLRAFVKSNYDLSILKKSKT
ncbi:hypothetical protein [Neptuniibacter sp. QD37_11]|uniref:hypothetical protein n=1 Tax=Neptuniibacter sp. QD37_11 TaxID=3398209 RepID=UPI0039F594D1